MVFKSDNFGPSEYTQYTQRPTLAVPGSLVTYVGGSTRGDPKRNSGRVERAPNIDDDLLGYNLGSDFVLVRAKNNGREFDCFVKLPFTKGVTERVTRRTMLIIGDLAHHGEAMQGQFDVALDPYTGKGKAFGDTLRWVNVGDTTQGFIGLDYQAHAPAHAGVAKEKADVVFLCQALLQYGYDPKKRLYLLEPPNIRESASGKTFRKQGLETLLDWSKAT